MFSNIFGGKPWYQSLTGLGVVGLAVTQALETTGVVTPGTSQTVFDHLQAVSGLLVVLGIRKAAGGGVAQKS